RRSRLRGPAEGDHDQARTRPPRARRSGHAGAEPGAAVISRVLVEGVTKLYGRQRALGGVTIGLRPGRRTALMGPNGAGKSTLIGILSTLVRPSSGRVDVGGLDTPRAVRAAIGVLAHDSLVYPELSAVENLRFWGGLYDVPDVAARATAMLDEVGLDASARQRPARPY